MPFSRHLFKSYSRAAWSTVLNNNELKGVALLRLPVYLEHITLSVPQDCGLLFRVKPLQEADVWRLNFESCKGFPKRAVTYGVERLREINRFDPHLDTPLPASSNLYALNEPVFDMSDEILPGLVAVSCQACCTACSTEVLKNTLYNVGSLHIGR